MSLCFLSLKTNLSEKINGFQRFNGREFYETKRNNLISASGQH